MVLARSAALMPLLTDGEARKAQLHDEREHVQVRRDALFARLDLERLLAGGLPAAAFTPSPSRHAHQYHSGCSECAPGAACYPRSPAHRQGCAARW
jgi:hypothetical protein